MSHRITAAALAAGVLLAAPAAQAIGRTAHRHAARALTVAGSHTVSGPSHDASKAFSIYTATPTRSDVPFTVTVTATCTAADLTRDPFRGYTDLRATTPAHPTWPAADVSTTGTTRFTVELPAGQTEQVRIQSGCAWSLTAPDALFS